MPTMTMIEYSPEQFEEIKKFFPNLNFIEYEKKIKGELGFHVRYESTSLGDLIKWDIKPCRPGEKDCIRDSYSIEIDLNSRPGYDHLPVVIENDGRIQKFGDSLCVPNPKGEVHLNGDGTCCLGVYDSFEKLSLYDFMMERVFPYFVWESYYEKYKKKPPCGECPHDFVKAASIRIKDEETDIQFLLHERTGIPKGKNRNKSCDCGSGKKYKECCFKSDEEIEHKIRKNKQTIESLIRQRKDKINPRKNNLKK